MTTKALFMTAMGGSLLPIGPRKTFTRSAANILTSVGHGLDTGAGPFKVMTNDADAPAGLVVARHSQTFATLTTAIATDELIIGGRTYTFVAAPTVADDVDVTTVDAHDAANMAAAINRDNDADGTTYDLDTPRNDDVKAVVTSMGALGAAAVLTLYAKTLDSVIGDAITTTSPDATIVVDAATLAGGASGTDYWIIKLTDDTFSVATTRALAEAGTAVAITDAGTGIHELVGTVNTLADSLEDVVNNFLTATGSRVLPAAFNQQKFWQAAIDGIASGSVVS